MVLQNEGQFLVIIRVSFAREQASEEGLTTPHLDYPPTNNRDLIR